MIIDGKQVTEKNAWRFVKARRPHAEARRERDGRRSYSIVRDRTPGAPIWCYGTGKTAGAAWLQVAQQMIEHDERIAEQVEALGVVTVALHRANVAEREAAALRYAAVRIEQRPELFTGERKRYAELLRKIAGE